MDATTKAKIRSLDSRICRAKKLGRTDEVEALRTEREALKNGAPAAAPRPKAVKKPNLTIPSTTSRTHGVALSRAAIETAIAEFGITRPVKIKWSAGRNRVGGCGLRRDPKTLELFINITVSGLSNPTNIVATLWHELTHARQMEDFDSPQNFMRAYKRYGYTGHAYMNNPYEVEARTVAHDKVAAGASLISNRPLDAASNWPVWS